MSNALTAPRRLFGLLPSGAVAVSKQRKALALGIAALADVLQVAVFPAFVEGAASPFDDALDAAVALSLLFVLGFRWRLAFALAIELVPGAALFPSWTAVVLSVASAPAALPPAPADAPATVPEEPPPAPPPPAA